MIDNEYEVFKELNRKLCSENIEEKNDVAGIIKRQNIAGPEQLEKKLDDYGFEPIDEALILEAFGLAYGYEWLEEYYIENEERINKRIKENR